MSSPLRRAATVILSRPGEDGLEVYLLRRSTGSAFVPNAFVFPGGAVDPADADVETRARLIGVEDARIEREFRAEVSTALPVDAAKPTVREGAALFAAALRELFEEAGILLSDDPDEMSVLRGAVRAGDMTFAQALARCDAYADARELKLFSHWITPPSELATRRYDAYFFIARAPQSQLAVADASETHDGVWIAPSHALERWRQGALHLVYPTVKHLERIVDFKTPDELFAFAQHKEITSIMPTVTSGVEFELPRELEGAW